MASISLKNKSKSGNLTAPGDVDLGAMIPIATTVVGAGGTGTITFNNIPSNYSHLQLRGIMRGNTQEIVRVYLNNDSAANWSAHMFYSAGSGAFGVNGVASTGYYLTRSVGVSTGANIFTALILDILDYTNTNKYKTAKNMYGWDANGTGFVGFESANWMSTAAVNRLDLVANGYLFQQYSHFALYGIKMAGA